MSPILLSAALTLTGAFQADEAKAKEALAAFDKGGGRSKKEIEVHTAIAVHLSPVRHPLVAAKLIELLKHPGVRIRGEATIQLTRYPNSVPARTALLELLVKELKKSTLDKYGNDAGHELAVSIISGLAEFKSDPAFAEPLLKALKHDCPSLRMAAATACGRMKLLETGEALIAELTKIEAITAEPLKDERSGGPKPDQMTAAHVKQKVENRHKTEVGPVVKSALQSILGLQVQTAAEFAAYWKENAEKLRAAKP